MWDTKSGGPFGSTFQSLTFDRHSWGGATGEFFRVRTVQLDDFSAESADLSFHHDIAKCQDVAGNRKTDPVHPVVCGIHAA